MAHSGDWVIMAEASHCHQLMRLRSQTSMNLLAVCVCCTDTLDLSTHHWCHAALQGRGVQLASAPWGCCLLPPRHCPSSHPRVLVSGRHPHHRSDPMSERGPASGLASPALPQHRGYCRRPYWETWTQVYRHFKQR